MNDVVERALGEQSVQQDQDVEMVDSTVPPTPEDFDMDAWLAGVRPTRRSVKLYPQAHLIARLDEIALKIEQAPEDEDVDDLIDEFEKVKAQFHEGIWFTVEKRSSEWAEKFRKDLCKRLNLKEDRDETVIGLHQLVQQIVAPAGITFNHLRALGDANQGELNKLLAAMVIVNNNLAEKSEVLTRDFSGRRSAGDQG